MDTHRPVDVLADRTPTRSPPGCSAHPGIQVICRDRAGAYAEGARTRRAATRSRSPTAGTCGTTSPNTWRRPSPATTAASPPPRAPGHETHRTAPDLAHGRRRAAARADTGALVAAHPATPSSRSTRCGPKAKASRRSCGNSGWPAKTVRRFVRAGQRRGAARHSLAPAGPASSTTFTDHLHQRLQRRLHHRQRAARRDPCAGLPRQLRHPERLPTTVACGRGRATGQPAATEGPARSPPGSLRHPDNLDDDDQLRPQPDRPARLPAPGRAGRATSRAFAEILTGRHGERLDWLDHRRRTPMTCPTCTPSPPGSPRDHDAVLNGLTLPLQLRRRRRPRQPHQNDQATDVRPRQPRPAPQTRPTRHLTAANLDHESGPDPGFACR